MESTTPDVQGQRLSPHGGVRVDAGARAQHSRGAEQHIARPRLLLLVDRGDDRPEGLPRCTFVDVAPGVAATAYCTSFMNTV